MTKEQLDKARAYAIDKMRYNEIHSIFNEIETSVRTKNTNKKHQINYLTTIGFIINRCFALAMDEIRQYSCNNQL
mgnify:CR=1 FL=1